MGKRDSVVYQCCGVGNIFCSDQFWQIFGEVRGLGVLQTTRPNSDSWWPLLSWRIHSRRRLFHPLPHLDLRLFTTSTSLSRTSVMGDISVGIIGMGDMGRMYAQRFSEAGWR